MRNVLIPAGMMTAMQTGAITCQQFVVLCNVQALTQHRSDGKVVPCFASLSYLAGKCQMASRTLERHLTTLYRDGYLIALNKFHGRSWRVTKWVKLDEVMYPKMVTRLEQVSTQVSLEDLRKLGRTPTTQL